MNTTCLGDKQVDYPPCPRFDPCHENYFVTSTGIGHRHIPHAGLPKRFINLNVPNEEKERGVILKEDRKQTTFSKSYRWHFNENESEKICSVFNPKVEYIKKFGERMKSKPPIPFQIFKSEYQQKYPYISVFPANTKCVDVNSQVFCKVVAYDKDLRPTLTPESGGFARYLDPYNSTTRIDYHGYDPHDIEKYKGLPEVPKFQLSLRVKPVYDTAVFKSKYIEKISPKVINHVPHSGLESEMKGQYKFPNDEVSLNSRRTRPPGMKPITGPPKTDVFLVPFMYHTEYNKLGKNIYICDMV